MNLRSFTVVFALACAGCLSKPTVVTVRTYAPALAADADAATPAAPMKVRFDRLRTAAHLESQIVWQKSATEWGRYDDRQWLEKPVYVVQRALERELYERRHFTRTNGKADVNVDGELTNFEEVLSPEHGARVTLVLSWGFPDGTARQQTVSKFVPVTSDDAPDLAEAMGQAVTQVVIEAGATVATFSTP